MSKQEFPRLHRRLTVKSNRPDERSIIYVAIGDSVTQGCLGPGQIEHHLVYHELFRGHVLERYPAANFCVINSGVAGSTAEQSRARWERDVIGYHPDLVTICFGLNDCGKGDEGLDPFIQAIHDLVTRIRSETEAEVLLLTTIMMIARNHPHVPECYRSMVPDFLRIHEAGYLAKYNDRLRRYAAEHDIPLLDVYAQWEQMVRDGEDIHDRLSNGLNHPDVAYHKQLAGELKKKILE
ncbi:GDSL-type esterase/lipase family protein [Cohnella ginsengisoli]|uniref:GDSL-type esterase/lipase family protein n=1 Tax=Cohnella ginsengisoli TaxID=425004 RepID=A0A9X4KG20_9BACL|nr:GDSL-type esterase/lipase family protein [Cohnella ginsengisoli]MDG0791305.1 GDSL-type esterase/lipase family protein [Cohnella ginsengisoli]